jgi:serine protease Do
VIGRSIKASVLGALMVLHVAACRRADVEGFPRVTELIRAARPAVVRVRAEGAMAQEAATGFIVAGHDGGELVVTNHHVIWGAGDVSVETSAGAVVRADVAGSDPASDLAVLRARARLGAGHPLVFGDDRSVNVGDWVVALGNPGGVSGAASVGVVAARGKVPRPTVAAQTYVDYLFTSTAVAAGSSGGPVLSLDGRVIGVDVAAAGQSGGLAIVIPAGLASRVVGGLERDGAYQHTWSGHRITQDDFVARGSR